MGVPSDKILVLPPIVRRPPEPPENQNWGAQSYVLALGHLEYRKNLETLVRATQELSWPDDLELWLAGADNGSLDNLRRIAGPNPRRVRFLGAVTDSEKWHLLSRATLVAVPSLIEGFGIVAVEAPLMGTPAIVSDRTSLAELAEHPLATVNPTSPSDWAERIAKIYASPDTQAEILEAQMALSNSFAASSLVPKLLDFYKEILT